MHESGQAGQRGRRRSDAPPSTWRDAAPPHPAQCGVPSPPQRGVKAMSMADTAMPTVSPAPATTPITISATLAANEALAVRKRAGETVLPLAFGEAGLPAHPMLRAA